MAAIDFSKLMSTLTNDVKDLARQTLGDYVRDGIHDGLNILTELSVQLELWTHELAAGEISKDDLEYNILTAKDLVRLVELKQAGLAAIKTDQFKNAVFELILQTVLSVIP